MRKKTHERVDKIMDNADRMKESSKEWIARLKEETIGIKERVDRYIRENPEKSVMIASGIGAVIGVIFATMMKRKS